ncbi:flagellar protein G [Pyrococcus yayanosii]|uniref:Putative flagella-related protein g n=1 Tax=Pyrococcus yayanosii (strain CH1 / JCM 16557) TaxID=529709 RepID=F8AF87_PYRYC|nr:flagellar protein G [Pyrococcus yayanosii]AEH24915.1 putative flagella-related protein g [Pyrococcus yayanosii CH1]
MAAGGPVSELIMFIVAVIVAGTVAGALAYVTTDIAGGIKVRGASLADQLRTDFAIINDPANIPVEGTGPYNYTFYIKNIGRVPISFTSEAVQVFIDGNLIPPANLTFMDVNGNVITSLDPYEVGVIKVTLGTQLSAGYHKLVVVLENGKKRSLVFEI